MHADSHNDRRRNRSPIRLRYIDIRWSWTAFETGAKSLGSIEYDARPFVRDRIAVA